MTTVTEPAQTAAPTAPAGAAAGDDPEALREWTRRIRASDPAAFEAFFRALHPSLVGYARSMVRDQAMAGDLVQDAFVRIWEGRHRLDPDRSIRALAYRTVRNLCLNQLRDRDNREQLLAASYQPAASTPPGPAEALGASQLAGRLERWIGELPDRQRQALQLSRFQGLSHGEVAEVMGVSPRTVNNHLVRALGAIRDRVREWEPSLLDT